MTPHLLTHSQLTYFLGRHRLLFRFSCLLFGRRFGGFGLLQLFGGDLFQFGDFLGCSVTGSFGVFIRLALGRLFLLFGIAVFLNLFRLGGGGSVGSFLLLLFCLGCGAVTSGIAIGGCGFRSSFGLLLSGCAVGSGLLD